MNSAAVPKAARNARPVCSPVDRAGALPDVDGVCPDFRPVGEVAAMMVARAMAGTGDLAPVLLSLLRDHGGALTLSEVCAACPVAHAKASVPVRGTLNALEKVGLVHRRDMVTLTGSELVWWAPRVPFAMPWTDVASGPISGGAA